ncbi:hypothetical protein FUAX_29980 [Fulvitalea axinellae]|uniref:Outer membrane protein beta-barrel domain-containing protein n=1 Tax=Fulvitalea axinellae TaxID=1182444 RepID=A0AAU9CEK7_9BACT|nr:hypothetical protein FUAX_29980 [Fulvitalea axinellae]
MKKLYKVLPFAFIVFLSTVSANAQDHIFRLKGGPSLVNFIGNDAKDASSKIGYQLGMLIEFRLTENFSIQPELVYSKEGARFDKVDEDINLSYANLPVIGKYYASKNFSFQAGPQLGLLTGANVNGENGDGQIKVEDYFSTLNLTFNIGMGLNITEKIGLDLRYNLGITNVSDDLETTYLKLKGATFRTSNLFLSLAYTIE